MLRIFSNYRPQFKITVQKVSLIKYIFQTLRITNRMLQFVNEFYKKHNLRPVNATWLAFIHFLGSFGLVWMLINYDKFLQIFGTLFIMGLGYCLGITAGSHRLWAHRSYQASLPLRIFLMVMNSGMFQGPIYSWCRDHRLHHKFSDTKLDPHNISKGFFYAHVGWLLIKKSPQLFAEGQKLDLSDLRKDPVIMFQRKYFLPLAMLMTFGFPTFILSFQVPIVPAFLISMLFNCYSLNSTWCVNSICHMFGSRKWNPNIEPRDNYFVSVITHGEGYHNWHHEFPYDWRASKNEWYMVNWTTYFLQIMSFLGLAKLKN